jgi:hypothetical protein
VVEDVWQEAITKGLDKLLPKLLPTILKDILPDILPDIVERDMTLRFRILSSTRVSAPITHDAMAERYQEYRTSEV